MFRTFAPVPPFRSSTFTPTSFNAGVPVFTTKAQKAAPKHAVWECKTLNADHIRIGPFLIATNDPHGPTEQRGGTTPGEDEARLSAQGVLSGIPEADGLMGDASGWLSCRIRNKIQTRI